MGESFVYDNVDRVTTWQLPASAQAIGYVYDDAGNLRIRVQSDSGGTVNEGFGYGENGAGPHALTSGPSGTYAYDAMGRQTARPGQPVLSYTRFDLPTAIQRSDGTTVSFGYDAGGARVVKSTGTNQVITLGGLYERRVENGGTTHVFFLPGDRRAVGQISCDGNGACSSPTFFHPDRLGTIDTVTRQGAVVGREKRDPFGRTYSPASMSGADESVTIGFIGQGEDADIGLVNLDHRLYDARLGRFVSPDPLVKSLFAGQDYNRYAYAANNPLSFVDPTGLQTEPPPTDDTDFDVDFIDPGDVFRIVAGPTRDEDGVTVRYTTFEGPPSGVGDPTAPFSSLQSPELLPPIPTFNLPPSSSQDFVNQPQAAQGRDTIFVPNVGDVGVERVLAANGDRDWFTGEPGKFTIYIPLPDATSIRGFFSWIGSLFRAAPAAAPIAGGALAKFASDPVRLNVLQQIYQNGLRASQTVANQLAGGRSYIPVQNILQTVGNGVRTPDPQGVANQFMYMSNAVVNGTSGILKVLVNEESWQVFHVLFKRGFSLE